MTIEILKETLTETGNPFVWITDLGWYFNEQANSTRYTAEQVFAANSFEDLAKQITQPTEATPKSKKSK